MPPPTASETSLLPAPASAPPHTRTENVLAVVTGAFLASLGLFVLDAGDVTTGGTAGLAILVARTVGWPFPLAFLLVSVPFVVLAVRGQGWGFTLRSAAALGLVATFSAVHPHAVDLGPVEPVYAALVGNLLAGVGILVVFRHGSSLGGFNVVALMCQERLGLRAGYVQMALDVAVVLAFAAVSDLGVVLASGAGAVLLNLVIALNHRPGRYAGA